MTSPTASFAFSTAYEQLLKENGGSWPPKPSYDFPEGPLLTLHEMCLEAPDVLCKTMDVSRLSADLYGPNRRWIEERLPPSEATFDAIKKLDQNRLLGISATVTVLSHLYRWGTIPSLTAAQEDKQNSLPSTLLICLQYLNARFGIHAAGGTLSSTYYYNWNHDEDRLQYMVTKNFDKASQDAERWTAKLFVAMEEIVLPLYSCLPRFAAELEAGKDSTALEEGVAAVKAAFAYFYKNLKPDVVKKDVWARYVQGFYGWGWDECEGVSGNQAFMVRTLDALLGVPNHIRPTHLSGAQRAFVWAGYDANLRALAKPYPRASKSLDELVRMLKTWRMGHFKKAYYYEEVDLPERKPMTGGYGTDADAGLEGMLARMTLRLKLRTALTA